LGQIQRVVLPQRHRGERIKSFSNQEFILLTLALLPGSMPASYDSRHADEAKSTSARTIGKLPLGYLMKLLTPSLLLHYPFTS